MLKGPTVSYVSVKPLSLSVEENQLANTDGHPNCQVNSVLLLED